LRVARAPEEGCGVIVRLAALLASAAIGCGLLSACAGSPATTLPPGSLGSSSAPTTISPPATSDPTSGPTTSLIGEGEPAMYAVTIVGRTVQLPIETTFAARNMPPADVGAEVDRFDRPGNAAIEVLDTPWRGETHHQPEFALESGDFTSSNSKAGIVQVVTNFGMWKYVPNGPMESSRFPTHIGELVNDRDGFDLVYYMDDHLLLNAMSLESIPNLFVSHSSGFHSLRIIRVGTIKIRVENGGRSVSGEIDLIGWAATVDLIVDPFERAPYRYQATFTGAVQN
jgi:hypothetical protein